MQTFVARYELVREREAGHEPAFFEPEDRAETARKEDALDGRERDEPLDERGVLFADPAQSPLRFFLYARDRFHGMEQSFFVGRILDVSIDQQ